MDIVYQIFIINKDNIDLMCVSYYFLEING